MSDESVTKIIKIIDRQKVQENNYYFREELS